jgi:hypothetical protein
MNTQPTQTGPTLPAGGPATRASDADRDAAAGLINEAFAEGRLTADEHDQRLSAACAARSWQELHELTADLPAPPGADLSVPPGAADPMARGVLAGADLCLLCALLVVCPPAGIVWWLLSRRRQQVPPAGAWGRTGQHAEDR